TRREDKRHPHLDQRMKDSRGQLFATTVIRLEEQAAGWLAAINRRTEPHAQIPAYDGLLKMHRFLAGWQIMSFDAQAAEEFKRLKSQKTRVASRDLKIAAIALVNNSLLLSANLRDFRRVPGLQVEDWLH